MFMDKAFKRIILSKSEERGAWSEQMSCSLFALRSSLFVFCFSLFAPRSSRKRLKGSWRFVCAVVALMALMPAIITAQQEEVYLRAESRYFKRLPVLLKPVQLQDQADAALGNEILGILETDLKYSSVIDPRREDSAIAFNPVENLVPNAEPVQFAVETAISLRSNRLLIQTTIMDLKSGKSVDEQTYHGCMESLRITVHTIADDIVKQLTGENGIAKSRVAFTAKFTDDSKEIYIADYDGHNRKLITRNRTLNLTPAWTTDGNRLVATSYQNQNPDLYLIDPASGRMMALFQGPGLNTSPAVSPDGRTIAFVSSRDGNAEIYLIDINGKNLRRLTNHRAIDTSPDWSPTGREIVFTSDRLGKPQLFSMDAEGSNLRRLPVDLEYCDSPAWSPRGDKIAFVSRIPGGFDIFTFDITTQTLTRLTENNGSNEDPCWSPDGFRLAFSSTRDKGQRDIYTIMWEGSQVLRLTFNGGCSSPSWSPNKRPPEDLCAGK